MKKFFTVILAVMFLFSAMSAFGTDIKVVVNGEEVMFDRAPISDGEKVFIPFRFVAQKLGANVSWHQETQTVFAEYNGNIITTQIGNNLMFVNDKVYTLSDAPFLNIDRTMAEASVFENGMGAKVSWDKERATIKIEK